MPGGFIISGNIHTSAGPTSSGKNFSYNINSGNTNNTSTSKNYFQGKETSEEALTKIYLDKNLA